MWLIFLLSLLIQPAQIVDPGVPPAIKASWTAPKTATIVWTGYGAVWRIPTYDGVDGPEVWLLTANAGAVRLRPGPETDRDKVPRAGDRYELRSVETGAVVAFTVLADEPQWYLLYFPMAAQPSP